MPIPQAKELPDVNHSIAQPSKTMLDSLANKFGSVANANWAKLQCMTSPFRDHRLWTPHRCNASPATLGFMSKALLFELSLQAHIVTRSWNMHGHDICSRTPQELSSKTGVACIADWAKLHCTCSLQFHFSRLCTCHCSAKGPTTLAHAHAIQASTELQSPGLCIAVV